MRKCYFIIVHLGINVPICLKHCAIGPYFGTHILTTIILGHTKILTFLSPLYILAGQVRAQAPHIIFFLPPLSLILSISSSHLPQNLVKRRRNQKEEE